MADLFLIFLWGFVLYLGELYVPLCNVTNLQVHNMKKSLLVLEKAERKMITNSILY